MKVARKKGDAASAAHPRRAQAAVNVRHSEQGPDAERTNAFKALQSASHSGKVLSVYERFLLQRDDCGPNHALSKPSASRGRVLQGPNHDGVMLANELISSLMDST